MLVTTTPTPTPGRSGRGSALSVIVREDLESRCVSDARPASRASTNPCLRWHAALCSLLASLNGVGERSVVIAVESAVCRGLRFYKCHFLFGFQYTLFSESFKRCIYQPPAFIDPTFAHPLLFSLILTTVNSFSLGFRSVWYQGKDT